MDAQFIQEQGGKLYSLLIIMCLSVVAIFAYMTYYVYNISNGTTLAYVTYIIAIPLFVSLIFFILLLVLGRDATLQQLISE